MKKIISCIFLCLASMTANASNRDVTLSTTCGWPAELFALVCDLPANPPFHSTQRLAAFSDDSGTAKTHIPNDTTQILPWLLNDIADAYCRKHASNTDSYKECTRHANALNAKIKFAHTLTAGTSPLMITVDCDNNNYNHW